MGKATKPINKIAKVSELRQKALQKIKKATNLIKKEKSKDEPKPLPKSTDDVEMKPTKIRSKKISSKKRRYLKLLKTTPQREQHPLDLNDLQVKSAQKMFKDNKVLSRGQRKRLQKKEKFVNMKIMEAKGNETQQLLKQKLQQQKQSKKQGMGCDDMKMEDVKPSIVKSGFGDFGGMSSLLDSINVQVQKQQSHSTQQRSIKKQQADKAQKEKERLQKIINLNSFQSNALDSIFQHVNNTVNVRNQGVKQ